MSTGDDRAIGIFDSGVGGLTVTDSIMKLLPQENLIYFGDTARCPYGPRSIDEVHEFLKEMHEELSDVWYESALERARRRMQPPQQSGTPPQDGGKTGTP